MIDSSAPILPGRGLGNVLLGSRLPPGNWTDKLEGLPWEISWLDKRGVLKPWVSEDLAVIAFVDDSGAVSLLYATPDYRGFLFEDLRPGMLGEDIISRHPEWKFRDFDSSIADPENKGVYFKHQEFDLWDADWTREKFDFIAVYRPGDPNFG